MSKRTFPIVGKRGSVRVNIYFTPSNGCDAYTIAYYFGGKRVRKTFADLQRAELEAETIANRICAGELNVLTLTSEDRTAYVRAMEMLKPSGTPLEMAIMQFVEAVKLLDGASIIEAAKCYLRVHPRHMPTRTVALVLEEMLVAKEAAGFCAAYLGDLRSTLRRFATEFPRPITLVLAQELRGYTTAYTRHDQVDAGLECLPVEGRLIAVVLRRRGFRPQTLLLFTTLVDVVAYPAAALLELYGQRWEVELNFRYLKAELGLAQLEVKSADLAQKEFYAGLIAYNLIRGVMLAAAVQSGQPVGQLSLAGAWRLVRAALGDWGRTRSRPAQRQRLAELWQDVAACRLPRRKKPRPAEPRRTWHLRETFPPMRGSQAAARRALKKQRVKS